MLKNIFKKEEESSDVKKIKNNRMKTELIVYVVIIAFAFGFILTANKKNNQQENITPVIASNKEAVLSLFNSISNNYTLIISKNMDDVITKLNYSTASNLTMYESSIYDESGYLTYNDSIYYLKNNEILITNDNKWMNLFNSKYYDLSFIKDLIIDSEEKIISSKESQYTITLLDYINKYNEKYNTNFGVINNTNVTINIKYNDTRIKYINIDYSAIDHIINKDNNYNIISYNIELRDIDSNNFDNIIEYIISLEK